MRSLVAALFASAALPLLAQTADVRVQTQTSRPGPLPAGEFGDITIAVQNLGPEIARNLRVEFTATEGVRFRNDARVAGCAFTPTKVTCSFGDFAPGVTYSGAEVDLPFAVGTHVITATVLTDSNDPNLANNSGTISVQTIQVAAVHAGFFNDTQRVEPGATVKVDARVGTNYAFPNGTRVDTRFTVTNGTVASVTAPPNWSCTITSPTTVACTTLSPLPQCCTNDQIELTIVTSTNREGGLATVTAEAQAQHPGVDLTARDTTRIDVIRYIPVTNTNDSGAGSLREAIHTANAHCSPQPCRMVFEIPGPVPPDGYFTITPDTPLPPVEAERVRIEGQTQTALTGNTNAEGPEVMLDGRRIGTGLAVHSPCDAVVRGLGFRNFSLDQGLWLGQLRQCSDFRSALDDFLIADNLLESNLRGLRLDYATARVQNNVIRRNQASGVWMWTGTAWLERNVIESNGASGIFLGPLAGRTAVLQNTISGHPHMAVAIAHGAKEIDVRMNRMRENGGLGIDWGLDGVSPQRASDRETFGNAPVLLAAVYDAATDTTNVTVSLRTQHQSPYTYGFAVIELFANDSYETEGQTPLTWDSADALDGTPFTVSLRGDHRGKWIIATSTRGTSLFAKPPDRGVSTHGFTTDVATTSEFSNTLPVQ